MTLTTNTHPVILGDSKCANCAKPVADFRWPTEACPSFGPTDQARNDLLVNLELWRGALPLDDNYHRDLLTEALNALTEENN